MDRIIRRALSILIVCTWTHAATADQLSAGGDFRHYDLSLQPGQHLIIVQAPIRRVIKVDNIRRQTVTVAAKNGMAPPFIHLQIAKPSISAPALHRFSSL